MRSALPRKVVAESPASKMKKRLCSRKRPRMLRTRIVSESPETPGRSWQIERATMSISAPACEAAYSSSMIVWSVSAFVFKRMRACSPSPAALATARISSTRRPAQVERCDEELAERLRAAEPRDVVEEVGDVGGDLLVGREEAEVLVDAGCERVVVASPDVDVAPERVALAPDDQSGLRVDLEVGEAVDDVDANPLHGPRPLDVPVLVEACLELDEADGLAPVLGHLDQGRDDRRVVARPVHGRLQRDHGRVPRRLAHEALERGHEGVVRVVDEQVAATDLGEEPLASPHSGDAGRRARHPGLVLQVLAVERRQLGEIGEVERPADRIHLLLARRRAPRSAARASGSRPSRRPRAGRRRRTACGAARAPPPRAGRRPRR